MGNFACPKCGVIQQDSERGYVAGCSHYPPIDSVPVTLRFDETGERDRTGWAVGGVFYVSKRGEREFRSVHPLKWWMPKHTSAEGMKRMLIVLALLFLFGCNSPEYPQTVTIVYVGESNGEVYTVAEFNDGVRRTRLGKMGEVGEEIKTSIWQWDNKFSPRYRVSSTEQP